MNERTPILQRFRSLLRSGRFTGHRAQAPDAAVEPREGAAQGYPATLLADAAERCAAAGDEPRALACFGWAIDVYLESGCFAEAASLCQRVIGLYPQVVRARCTLAFLLLGQALPHRALQQLLADAQREIGIYVAAAHRTGHAALAARRLRLMAEVTDRHELRELIGEYLLDLGDPVGAEQVFGGIRAERNQLQPSAARDQPERWALALRVSVVSPDSPPAPPLALA